MHKRLWFALAWMLGCGDDEDEQPSRAALACASSCARAAAARCPNQPRDCVALCEHDIAATPARCIAEVSAYASCTATAVWTCDGTGVAEATSCQAQRNAWLACASGGMDASVVQGDAAVSDAGLSCEPSASDTSCQQCLKRDCCSSLSACDEACQGLLSCSQDCETEACSQDCELLYPRGFAGVSGIFACLQRSCAAACAD